MNVKQLADALRKFAEIQEKSQSINRAKALRDLAKVIDRLPQRSTVARVLKKK